MMDEAYNAHSPHSKRHSRSSTSLNKLSLAPLTSRLPIDADELSPTIQTHPRSPKPISYIEHRHVGPNPGVLSHPSSRSTSRNASHRKKLSLTQLGEDDKSATITRSKSSTHIHIATATLQQQHHKHKSGAMTPGPRPTHGHHYKHHTVAASEDLVLGMFSPMIRDPANYSREEDSWLLRTGALMTYGAAESKGQAWLVSRASSTNHTGQHNDSDSDDEDEKPEPWGSRRGSHDADDEFNALSPVTTRSFNPHSRSDSRFQSQYNSRAPSRHASRANSRIHSRRGSKVGLALTPSTKEFTLEGYFDAAVHPDFIDLPPSDELDEEERAKADEILVRRLVKTGTLGLGTWVERLMGWSLFAVEEDGETEDESDGTETETEKDAEWEQRKEQERQRWRSMLEREAEEQGVKLPPPPRGEGGWGDAAWLLSVATKVLL